MFDLLEPLMSEFSVIDYGEIRFHERKYNKIAVIKGELETANATRYSGMAIHVLYQGGWGFPLTNRVEPKECKDTIDNVVKAAKVSSSGKQSKTIQLAKTNLCRGKFTPKINDPSTNHSFDEKLELVRTIEAKVTNASSLIQSALVFYDEILDRKYILNMDGAQAEIYDSQPQFVIAAVALDSEEYVRTIEPAGTIGG